MSSGRVVRPGPMAEGRAQLKQKSNNRSQRLRDTPAFPIFHDSHPPTSSIEGANAKFLLLGIGVLTPLTVGP